MGVADAAQVEQGVGLGGDLAVAETEDDRDVGAEILGGEADGDVDEVVGGDGGDRPAALDADPLEDLAIVATADRDRDAGGFGEADAGGFGVPLDRDDGDVALLQGLREAEADLAEADQDDVVTSRGGTGGRRGW